MSRVWTDWIDYWAVDFNFKSKKKIMRVKREPDAQIYLHGSADPIQLKFGDYEEVWTGDYVFENEWQSFRTKKDRSLESKSVFRECQPKRQKIAVKVVDIFGKDTMKIVEVTVGGK
jgi:adenine-specific DNA-methyltransferase